MNKKIKKFKSIAIDVENIKRESFTPNWTKSISEVETLPIKRNGKVIRTTKESTNEEENENQKIIDSDDDNNDGQMKIIDKFQSKKNIKTIENKSNNSEVLMKFIKKTPYEMKLIQQKVADICSSIIANPEKSLKKKLSLGKTTTTSADDDDDNAIMYRMTDLFDMLASNDAQIFEIAMLSALVVFKDICPGYRIRSVEEYDKDVLLKKDTKQMKDFELSLLGSYQKYLKVLENKIHIGLGNNPRKEINHYDFNIKIGISALRCQCELLRSLSYFNFSSSLVGHIVTRSIQPDDMISSLCCDTIINLLKNDHLSEISYDIVKSIGKVLALCKYSPSSDSIIKCLLNVNICVHADDSKDIHRKAKSQRKKRKHNADEVELGYLEANSDHDKTSRMRYQADCLHEISLIYFRIVKMKVGYTLIPTALEGLSRITHLINIDMVQDLMTLLKNILEQMPPAPILIKLQCIHCALKTLSGPGQELNLDSDIYLYKLRSLLHDLPCNFAEWEVILDCLDICFLKKREERMNIVTCFTRLMILIAIHISETHAPVLYAMTHTILTRYPKVRQELLIMKPKTIVTNITNNNDDINNLKLQSNPKYSYIARKSSGLFIEDDSMNDLAMKALREESLEETHTIINANWTKDLNETKLGDSISWILPLQRLHIDKRYLKLTEILSNKELLPMPLRISDTKINKTNYIINKLTESLQFLPKTLKENFKTSHINTTTTATNKSISTKSKALKSHHNNKSKINDKSNKKRK